MRIFLKFGTFKGKVHPKIVIVINYSSSCRSKPARLSFIFRTQIKIFLMKSESSLILHRQLKCSLTQKHSKDICKTVHVTSVAQLPFCEATRILFVRKENKSNNLFNYSSPRVTIICILSPESNQFNQHCLYSGENTFMLNVNNADYVDYFLGKVHTIVHVFWYSPK